MREQQTLRSILSTLKSPPLLSLMCYSLFATLCSRSKLSADYMDKKTLNFVLLPSRYLFCTFKDLGREDNLLGHLFVSFVLFSSQIFVHSVIEIIKRCARQSLNLSRVGCTVSREPFATNFFFSLLIIN